MYVLGNLYTPSQKQILVSYGLLSDECVRDISFEIDLEKIQKIASSLSENEKRDSELLCEVIKKTNRFADKIQRQIRLVNALSRPPVLVMERPK